MAMTIHLPQGATFEGPMSEEDRGRIGRALQKAVQRALERSVAPQLEDVTAHRSGEIGQWPDLSLIRPSGHSYIDPGSNDWGEPAEAELLDHIPAPAAQRIQHPGAVRQIGTVAEPFIGAVAEPFNATQVGPTGGAHVVPVWGDQGELTKIERPEHISPATQAVGVRVGPIGLEAKLIAATLGNRSVYLSSPSYAVSSSFALAYQFGLSLFEASSFAVLQGPGEGDLTRYLTIGTEPSVGSAEFGTAPMPGKEGAEEEPAGKYVVAEGASLVLPSVSSELGTYALCGLVTQDRSILYPDLPLDRQPLADTDFAARQDVQTPATTDAGDLLFNGVDKLVAQGFAGDDAIPEKAADYLARFDASVFALVSWDRKVEYLKVLLAASTRQMRKQAVVAIFTSLRSDSEIDAVIEELRRAGCYDQLVKDLDIELYDLLVTVGELFAPGRNALSFEGLIELLDSMGLVSKAPPHYLTQISTEHGTDPVPPAEMLVEAHDAAMGVIRIGADLGASPQSIFADPDTVIPGVDAVAELIVNIWLADAGYQPAVMQIARTLTGLDPKTLAARRGADRLGLGENMLGRMRWRLLWEIAALFAGADAVAAIIKEIGAGETLPGAGRTRVRSEEVVDSEAQAVSVARLSELLNDLGAPFGSVEETAALISSLPEVDVQRLGELAAMANVEEGETPAGLAFRNPDLHAAVEELTAKLAVLKTLADKSGGLSVESIAVFQRLVGPNGLEVEAARRAVAALPEEEGVRFATALQRIPLHRFTPEMRAALLELLAASPSRMDALIRVGVETFVSVYRRVSGKAEALDTYLLAIRKLDKLFTSEERAADLRRLLDALERDEPDAWLTVENQRHLQLASTILLDGG